MGWLPIASLPAGKLALVWFPGSEDEAGGMIVASWELDDFEGESGPLPMWRDAWGEWIEFICSGARPTHWFPLPSAP